MIRQLSGAKPNESEIELFKTLVWEPRMMTFQELIALFQRKQHVDQLFKSNNILDIFKIKPPQRNMSPLFTQELTIKSQMDANDLLKQLGGNLDGLTEDEVEIIRKKVGLNELVCEKPSPWWIYLWFSYTNPFNLLLTVLALISYYTEDMTATVVISIMVVLATLIRFWQEFRSNHAAEKLKALVSNTATVLRRVSHEPDSHLFQQYFKENVEAKLTRKEDIPIKQLVPGDIILLSAGDMIPADCRLLTARDLFVSQSAMTGESLPIEKFAAQGTMNGSTPFELDNILLMGTNVMSGTACALVFCTGNQTYFGFLAAHVTRTNHRVTAFQMGVNKVSWLLIRFMLVMTPIVFFINGFTKGNWMEAFLFAMSVAIGLTPEMLPMIVTSTLAKGAIALSRKKVIVKRLDAIHNFGAMDILCTDKTGTLTQDKIILESYTDVFGKDSDKVLEFAYLNSFYQTGLKNLLDRTVLEHIEIHKELKLGKNYHKIDEIPFDFERRRMSVVVSERDDHHELICKGALEEILKVCTHVQNGDAIEPLLPEMLSLIHEITGTLNEDGLRVVAVASKELPMLKKTYGIQDELGLTLIGYIAFLDPPKDSTAPALRSLKEHGITVKILTGDNERVTKKVCKDVDMEIHGVLLGPDIEIMTDEELSTTIENVNVFSRLTPIHKERIVALLRKQGHTVGFLGDGINDAPALRTADIGISVDSAVDIAKEAADIILLEKSLMILERGVIEGRRTFFNMLKYIKMTASSNFGNVLSVVLASAFLPFLPMLPLQLLVQNLLYDISQIAIPFDNVDKDSLKQPQRWNPDDIGRFMIYFGPISSIFDIITFCLLWYYFGADTPEKQAFFQTGWFVEGLLSQTLIVHMIRTRKIPFIQSRASWPLIATTLGVMLVGIFLPLGPFGYYFKFVPLPESYFYFLLGILFSYVILTQLLKNFYAKHYGWQ